MYICVYLKISLTVEPIWFSFAMQFRISLGKVNNYSGEAYHHYPNKKCPPPPKKNIFLYKLKLKMGEVDFLPSLIYL